MIADFHCWGTSLLLPKHRQGCCESTEQMRGGRFSGARPGDHLAQTAFQCDIPLSAAIISSMDGSFPIDSLSGRGGKSSMMVGSTSFRVQEFVVKPRPWFTDSHLVPQQRAILVPNELLAPRFGQLLSSVQLLLLDLFSVHSFIFFGFNQNRSVPLVLLVRSGGWLPSNVPPTVCARRNHQPLSSLQILKNVTKKISRWFSSIQRRWRWTCASSPSMGNGPSSVWTISSASRGRTPEWQVRVVQCARAQELN